MAKKAPPVILTPKQLGLLIGIIALMLFVFGYTSRVIANRELQAEVAQWEEEVHLEGQRLQANKEWLEYVQTDAYVIEKAHEDLGWAFSDEVAIRVVGQEQPQVTTSAVAAAPEPGWRQWWERFFGR